MTNLLFTITVVLSTNWTGTSISQSPGMVVEVGRLQTNYTSLVFTNLGPAAWEVPTNTPTLTAGPFYGPYEFVRVVKQKPPQWYGMTNIMMTNIPWLNKP